MLNHIGTKLYLLLRTKYIGSDNFGNLYYQAKTDYNALGKLKRFVFFKGKKEATKVPPTFNAWLKHIIYDFPKNTQPHSWQQDYQCNLTGTKHAYFPSFQQKSLLLKAQYNAWTPSNNNTQN